MSAVVILGPNGVLGREVVRQLQARQIKPVVDYRWGWHKDQLIHVIDAAIAHDNAPIINCAGKIPQNDPLPEEMLLSNSVMPHALYTANKEAGFPVRVIHMSSDCVFGRPTWTTHTYKHTVFDAYNPQDFYGLTKSAGEVDGAQWVNVRGSFISPKAGFWKWVEDAIENDREITGWSKAKWNGTTDIVLARELIELALMPDMPPSYVHIASDQITNKWQMIHDIAMAKGADDWLVDNNRLKYDFSHIVDRALLPTVEVPPISTLIWEHYNEQAGSK